MWGRPWENSGVQRLSIVYSISRPDDGRRRMDHRIDSTSRRMKFAFRWLFSLDSTRFFDEWKLPEPVTGDSVECSWAGAGAGVCLRSRCRLSNAIRFCTLEIYCHGQDVLHARGSRRQTQENV